MDIGYDATVRSWDGTWTYRPKVVATPRSPQDLVEIIGDPARFPSPVRPAGSMHSPARMNGDDAGTMVDIKAMNRILDFGEDTTKSNWGVEFTWVAKQNFFNNNEFSDGITQSDVLNLTVSVDRPTFINFLNANRTFFINSQWFFQYITNYKDGFAGNGPLNVLFTVAIFTGYFQDRLNPQFVTVYNFDPKS